ncbi:telomere repeat-binding protein 2-like isoform X2 [Amaranthus tricolor]|nr:telomere repeat-binding protein 2-like isoform X2 [Amaranthus tricolor]
MQEKAEADASLKTDCCDKESAVAASLNLELGLPVQDQVCNVKEIVDVNNYASSPPDSAITLCHCLEKDENFVKMDIVDDKSDFCSPFQKPALCGPGHVDLCDPNLNDAMEQDDGKREIAFENGAVFSFGKAPAAASSDCSIKLSLGADHYSSGSLFPCRGNNVKVVSRDDDENSSECIQPSITKSARIPARIGNRKIRRLLGSKYWKVASKVKDGDYSETEPRCIYRSRKTGYKRQRSQRLYLFKKRKIFRYNSLSNSDGDTDSKGVYDSSGREIDQTVSAFSTIRNGVDGSSLCIAGQSTAFASRESHVKLRIKSFRVPELFIEMPETATIGSLKRTVLDAVTALLGGGLRVGVLLQGKKIRDDNKTLVQSGICCHDDKVKSLGFTLEPNPSHSEVSTDEPQPVSRFLASGNHQGASHDHLMCNIRNLIESDHDSAPSPAETTVEKGAVDSRALVPFPDGTPQALAILPAHQKSKRSEMAQRRIRRPFSVSEVEALVQAVEKLGTGRWRDVKLRAFDNVKHRTYVDLKDKWKTLVHTARISPQQRRGEPVPQELLDRVLSAHSYWSQQQAKQQLKQPSEPCLLL